MDVAGERERDGVRKVNGNRADTLVVGAAGRCALAPAVDCGAAGADATRVMGMTGWRPRAAVGGGVGRREAREGGVKDWEWWYGLSGDGMRGEDRDVGSEELPVSALRGGDEDSGAIVVGGVRECDDWDDPCELIVASLLRTLGSIYTYTQ